MSMPATAILGVKDSDFHIGFLYSQKANEPNQASPGLFGFYE
ncbi:MAG TPA: hypothetical protein PK364_08835 [Synergistaceae bacterium]|nr:hypothetical protein [Synergistaceae bacterium]HPJ26306.1 hypothetical protein [Synergistaceae bacterium]HPQ37401.1 hypothetical protein [Synergistaceae bacterium]